MVNNFPSGYKAHKSHDPFPDIAPALLNSADIEDYARTIGLVDPFDPKNLKPASYEIPFAGEVHIWDSSNRKRRVSSIANAGDSFCLGPNSIAYVYPSTQIFLPDYIALRFNLRITHVHQGLLLGTGPLVDPGFCGRLLIPLHNLTSNDYVLEYGKGLIWIEFTKLSPNKIWAPSTQVTSKQNGQYVPFRSDKNFLSPEQYFEKANRGNPIISSIPEATSAAEQSAKKAEASASASQVLANKAAKRAMGTLVAAVFSLAVAIIAMIYAGYQLTVATNATVQDSVNYVKTVTDSVANRLNALEKQNAAAKESLKSTKSGVDSAANRLDVLERRIETRNRAKDGK